GSTGQTPASGGRQTGGASKTWPGGGQVAALPQRAANPKDLRSGTTQAPVIDIHEELTRLTSHLAQYRTYAKVPTPVGRQLDFLIQEINREINTIGSKGNSAAISQLVVEAKTTLEKLREQVQNIE
ncbi:MAG: DUF1732 domain-containing protein, partial [Deltaproteobacteria bacterium]|nr:DUF1732 domain-containing protein [Deltaproteobacteria bacterium]